MQLSNTKTTNLELGNALEINHSNPALMNVRRIMESLSPANPETAPKPSAFPPPANEQHDPFQVELALFALRV